MNLFKYIITYYVNGTWYDQDEVYTMGDANDMVHVAMEVGMCDRIDVHQLHEEDTIMVITLSALCGMWSSTTYDVLNNTTMMEVVQ